MATYTILDGYNLIGAIGRYRTKVTGGLAESREVLISDCLKAAGWTGSEMIVVFDAHGSPEPERHERRAGGAVRIVYSAPGQSADDVIERLLARLDGPSVVYTADFALQRTILARGAMRATPGEFEMLLDELPAVTRSPDRPARSRVVDRLSTDALAQLEILRRRAEREDRPGG